MRFALVAMPWARFSGPCAALGILLPYVRRETRGIDTVCHSEYLPLARRLGGELYRLISERRALGELLYLSQLYPERQDASRRFFSDLLSEQLGDKAFGTLRQGCLSWADLFDAIYEELAGHMRDRAPQLGTGFDVVGLTTSFAQTYSSLALAAAIKRHSPQTVIVLGGAGMARAAGPSILREYPFVDYVIQGEGERPLVSLLEGLREQRPIPPTPGLISRTLEPPPAGASAEIDDLDTLPIPDYDEYAGLSDCIPILWYIPIEASRGCWWDRTADTGNPKDKCHFCNYSNGRYRAKSSERVASEMEALADRYRNIRFGFCDNAIPPTGLGQLSDALRAGRKEYNLFVALRANIRPVELLALKKAGLVSCECGIEGLSSSYLRRLNKGTSVILNLQVMKLCHELGIRNNATLLTGFPGSTQAEVSETVHNILHYAIAYFPAASLSPFQLAAGSVVDRFRDEYGIVRVQKHEFYRVGLPEDVYARLELNEHEWQMDGPRADWTEVEGACKKWKELCERLAVDSRLPFRHPLYYQDGGTFMEILDRRHGYRSITLTEPLLSIYLFCMEIRSRDSIERLFAGTGKVEEALSGMVREDLMFEENGQYLSLAVASTPEAAEDRIRSAGQDWTGSRSMTGGGAEGKKA